MTKPVTHCAAMITIKNPGKMTKAGRQNLAQWMRRRAHDFFLYGDQYDRDFTARYLWTGPRSPVESPSRDQEERTCDRRREGRFSGLGHNIT